MADTHCQAAQVHSHTRMQVTCAACNHRAGITVLGTKPGPFGSRARALGMASR